MTAPPLKRKRSTVPTSTLSSPPSLGLVPSSTNPATPINILDTKSLRGVPVVETMAEAQPTHTPVSDDSSDEEQVDSDLEDGDTVLSRGWPRNHHNLEKHGFRPVWTSSDGYPGSEIPADIKEFLDEDGTCKGVGTIGPLRSLAWLAGLDELVEAIDSSAYTIEDSVEVVPFGTSLMWPVEWHIGQGKISSRIAERVFRHWEPRASPQDTVILRDKAPEGVTEKPTLFTLSELTGASRLQRSSGKIMCMKVTSQKGAVQLEKKINRLVEGCFESGRFWFRSLSVAALESTLAFFVPEASGSSRDNEFGPGFYTAESLQYSLTYLRGGVGAIMVFKDPDLFRCSVWQPGLDDWTAWVAKWISLPLAIASHPAPPQYENADFIKGPIRGGGTSGRGHLPTQSEENQLVAVSYKGCQVMSDSLYMIIFVDPK